MYNIIVHGPTAFASWITLVRPYCVTLSNRNQKSTQVELRKYIKDLTIIPTSL